MILKNNKEDELMKKEQKRVEKGRTRGGESGRLDRGWVCNEQLETM